MFGQNCFFRYMGAEKQSVSAHTGWTELLRRGGCLLPSLASPKGGYVCLTTFTRAPQHPLCVQPHTHKHSTAQQTCLGNIFLFLTCRELKRQRGLATHWMDRAPAAWWLPATVAGVSKRGIRMPDYHQPRASAAPPRASLAHTTPHTVDFCCGGKIASS